MVDRGIISGRKIDGSILVERLHAAFIRRRDGYVRCVRPACAP